MNTRFPPHPRRSTRRQPVAVQTRFSMRSDRDRRSWGCGGGGAMDKEGGHPHPVGTHEERFFKDGKLTPVVRDHGIGSYHDPGTTLTAPRDFGTASNAEEKEPGRRPTFRSVLSWLA